MCYIHTTKDYKMVGWIGDDFSAVGLHLFSDADFAGCSETQRSTSGVHLAVQGEHSNFPIAGISKRQGCVSHTTPEAEIVAGVFALRATGLPALTLWEVLNSKIGKIQMHADNKAMIQVAHTGRNPTMRHLSRTHRVDVAWLHEVATSDDVCVGYERTDKMAADIYTKGSPTPASGIG